MKRAYTDGGYGLMNQYIYTTSKSIYRKDINHQINECMKIM